jgi:hypothetical protein
LYEPQYAKLIAFHPRELCLLEKAADRRLAKHAKEFIGQEKNPRISRSWVFIRT